jgi:hypothetical protein
MLNHTIFLEDGTFSTMVSTQSSVALNHHSSTRSQLPPLFFIAAEESISSFPFRLVNESFSKSIVHPSLPVSKLHHQQVTLSETLRKTRILQDRAVTLTMLQISEPQGDETQN